MSGDDLLARHGLTPLLNASGTETVFGASPVHADIISEIAAILAVSVDMAELQALASRVIAGVTGAEAGYVTNCTSASIVIAAAAVMTGDDASRAERLPDTQGLRNEIVLQKGHVVNYGSLITGDIRLSGARPVEIGAAFDAAPYQLRAALSPATAAALYVVSHHTAQSGMIALKDFIHEAHAAGVPVIVDAAAEYDWPGIIAAGADLVLFSGQKAMGGPTAGIIAGRADLVRACVIQRHGVGRPMKAGKEAVIGAIAAMQRWSRRDEAAVQAAVLERAERLVALLQGLPGIGASIVPDETGNPFHRVILEVSPALAGGNAHALARAIANGTPRIIVRDLLADRGLLQVDVRRLDADSLALLATRIRDAAGALQALRGT
ncbi:aminotransferase class V-fold PLP-dependent enzyme [Starkeya sp. ORNL1]|uniref:aminotransferase class V-fold PLP-dependent enzyme n=1 Tax=Starkeya sp. ORNL1 TaxID=2709380 RepID=UPI0014647C49|nr:aminotransferase class V-fold PLP-dependent enzyme [Starkeya sp. ORNL1]QJP16854.1 aminotransferase class V-fold PLP-dependent enzyme [Starkeya sp. ORNL1]